jgi:hypothetical protein
MPAVIKKPLFLSSIFSGQALAPEVKRPPGKSEYARKIRRVQFPFLCDATFLLMRAIAFLTLRPWQ